MISPYYTDAHTTLYAGDVLRVLRELPDATSDCVVTSPPYWGLRDYGTGYWSGGNPTCTHDGGRGSNAAQSTHRRAAFPSGAAHRGGDPRTCSRCGARRHDGQYGLEATAEDYIDSLRGVFAELRRVLKPTGTVWLNMGDSYSATPPGDTQDPMRASTLAGRTAAARLRDSVQRADVDRTAALPCKNLIGMPWRVALALQADGWIVRNAIVWHKPNAMPESVRDRLSNRYELLFLLTQRQRYYFDLDAIRQPLIRPEAPGEGLVTGGANKGRHAGIEATARRRGNSVYGAGKYTDTTAFPVTRRPGRAMRPTGRKHTAAHPKGKNPGDVWSLPTRPLREAHFAAFPLDIPLRCIAAGCPPNGTVLDPFSGAATTGLAARRLHRSYLGIDLNPAFHDIALARLAAHRATTPPPEKGRAA